MFVMHRYIAVVAPKFKLPPQLVKAIVIVESSGDRWSWNPEPPYRYLWNVRQQAPFRKLTAAEISSEKPPSDFHSMAGARDAEWWGQQASWGYMQVMGAVAREHGFKGHFPGLCDPLEGLNYGCKHLAHLRKRFFRRYGWLGVIAAYNAGSPRFEKGTRRFVNQGYVDKVVSAGGVEGLA